MQALIGLVGVAILTRYLENILYGVKPLDAISVIGAMLFVIASAMIAGWIPARRAARIDPLRALRCEL